MRIGLCLWNLTLKWRLERKRVSTANTPEVRLVSINNKGKLTAKIEEMCIGQRGNSKGKIVKKTIEVGANDSLREVTHNDAYDGDVVREIYSDGVNEYVEFDNGIKLPKGLITKARNMREKLFLRYLILCTFNVFKYAFCSSGIL